MGQYPYFKALCPKNCKLNKLTPKECEGTIPKLIHHSAEASEEKNTNDTDDRSYDAIVDPTPYDPPNRRKASYGRSYFFIVIIPPEQPEAHPEYNEWLADGAGGLDLSSGDDPYGVLRAKGLAAFPDAHFLRAPNFKLWRGCPATPAPAPQFSTAPLDGGLGIGAYMERTLAASLNGLSVPTTFAFEKSYTLNVELGVTPGWYIPRGDYLPNAGATKQIYDDIKISFTPAGETTVPDPIPVYVTSSRISASPSLKESLDKRLQPSSDAAARLNNSNQLLDLQQLNGTLQSLPIQ